jgi:hypothetical protein
MKENISPGEDAANGHMASIYRRSQCIRRTSSCRQLKYGGPPGWEKNTELKASTVKTLWPYEM